MALGQIFEYAETGELTAAEDISLFITRRGGDQVVAELKPISGYFERKLDETSYSEVTTGLCLDTNAAFNLMDVMAYELEWWRDNRLVWAGPITGIEYGTNSVKINAADLTYWWGFREMPTRHFHGVDAAKVAEVVHMEAMRPDPIENFELVTVASNRLLNFDTYAHDHRPCLDTINEIASHAIDYTMYGRVCMLGGLDLVPSLPVELDDSHWLDEPKVESRGPAQGFATAITAIGDSDIEVVATYPEAISRYGYVHRAVEFPALKTQQALTEAALAYLSIFASPHYINTGANSKLRNGAPIPFEALVPGLKMTVTSTSTCKQVRSLFRVLTVRHELDGTVGISLEPVGVRDHASIEAEVALAHEPG